MTSPLVSELQAIIDNLTLKLNASKHNERQMELALAEKERYIAMLEKKLYVRTEMSRRISLNYWATKIPSSDVDWSHEESTLNGED